MYFLVLYIFYTFSTFFDTTDTLSVRTSGTSQVYCTPTKTNLLLATYKSGSLLRLR
jgi:hypothetical protein